MNSLPNLEVPTVLFAASFDSSKNLSNAEPKLHSRSEGDIKVFFTNDKDLVNQYYDLRQSSYRNDNGWVDYDGSENEFDRNGHVVVAVLNSKVIGGVRVMFSNECQYLSNEIPGTQFEYQKFIRKYDDRENLVLSEISALVVAKEHRDNSITSMMFDVAFTTSKNYGCHYVFAVAVAIVCRADRMTLRRLGYEVEIVINYPWKEKKLYNFTRMFPMYCKLR